ncbi:hypothetical protein DWY92_02760 [Bacteroides uniformis]|uniref:Uncharacterized protein n=1 Tax=Bacteroides uniformis TaxID=820 RepID=A0A412BJK8_BACUN|nr:hypothetical protein DXD58_02205 [Bacteroides sp. D20]RGQ54894.1 hypothetical protein DWY92_02760 [Bacteroides uniformis]RHC02552.1 hypothetical protein DW861_13160 [Bacteroides uniformis]
MQRYIILDNKSKRRWESCQLCLKIRIFRRDMQMISSKIIQKTPILSSLTRREIGFIIGDMLSWLNKGKGYVRLPVMLA